MRGMATCVSVVRLPSSRMAADQRHQLVGRHETTTDAPMRVRTSMRIPMLTPRHSSGGRRRTLPLRPCCCTAARRQQPPRSDEYASN
jgi:hypothetical protein